MNDGATGLVWRVECNGCPWSLIDVPTREQGVAAGGAHVDLAHPDDERWSFRVRGIRVGELAGAYTRGSADTIIRLLRAGYLRNAAPSDVIRIVGLTTDDVHAAARREPVGV